jgi:hypothetical protein
MRELITIKGTQRACLYGLGVLGLLGPSPPAKSKTPLGEQLFKTDQLTVSNDTYLWQTQTTGCWHEVYVSV